MANHEIIVGNLGTVCRTNNPIEAGAVYKSYVTDSKNNYGRVAGEPVTWMRDDEIHKEYAGTLEY